METCASHDTEEAEVEMFADAECEPSPDLDKLMDGFGLGDRDCGGHDAWEISNSEIEALVDTTVVAPTSREYGRAFPKKGLRCIESPTFPIPLP